jgi:hypothetical protein
MKRLIFSFTMLLLVTASFAQSDKYQKGMEKAVASLDSAKTPEELIAAAATFERIADAEKTQWLPYYYAGIAHIWRGFADQKANKDDVANQAESLLAKAEALEPKSAEIFIAKNMASTIHMLVDPMTRWQKYGAEAAQALGTAKQLEPNNPRVYFLEGQSMFGTPAAFGGGKDKAKPLFEKSIELFKTYQPASSLHPKWGLKGAEDMLARCR